MPRLVTFGCSFVYGHGLPDCHIPPDIPDIKPSQLGWPNMVADKLGMPCINLASPGIGNLAILMRVLKAELKPDDIVVTAFSYFDRYFCHQFIDKEHGTGVLINRNTPEHKRLLMSEIDEPFLEAKYYWHNWLAIQHVECYLSSKNIKNFSFHGVQDGSQMSPPRNFELKNFWDMILIMSDYALDGRHPGLESNRLQAEQIYNRIKHELR